MFELQTRPSKTFYLDEWLQAYNIILIIRRFKTAWFVNISGSQKASASFSSSLAKYMILNNNINAINPYMYMYMMMITYFEAHLE